ncbi:hypothetical protein MIDIC_110078 [Alphaproteobacteria bacterium]
MQGILMHLMNRLRGSPLKAPLDLMKIRFFAILLQRCDPDAIRTRDLLIKSQLLCLLSYGIKQK